MHTTYVSAIVDVEQPNFMTPSFSLYLDPPNNHL